MNNISHIPKCPTCGGELQAGKMFCSRTCRRPSEETRAKLREAKRINPPKGMLGKHITEAHKKKNWDAARAKIVGFESWVASRGSQSSGLVASLVVNGYRVLIDAEDAGFLSQFTFRGQIDKSGHLRVSTSNRCGLFGNTKKVHLSRMVLIAPSELQVDHINGDTTDNRKCNLRLATREENERNRGANRNNVTGFKGVAPKRNRFSAQIHLGEKKIHIGVYDTPEEAAHAYDKAAREIHGEFARTNF